jgi:integrase
MTFEEPWRPGSSNVSGDCPIEKLEPQAIKVLRDLKAAAPGATTGRLKSIRAVFTWAFEKEHVRGNKAQDVAYIRNPTDGLHTWTREEVQRFEDFWPIGSKPRLAMAPMLYTGARRSDLVTLGRQHIRDGKLTFAPAKTRRKKPGFRIEVADLPELQELLDQSPTGDLTFVVTEFGRPFSPGGFSVCFRARCDEAGLPECTAHGLRKAGATIMIENGATEHQVMAVYGWESPKEVMRYAKQARRDKLAGEGISLLRTDEK